MELTINIYADVNDGFNYFSFVLGDAEVVVNGVPNVGSGSSFAFTVADNTSAEITITTAGYRTYSMTIDNVYATDKSIDILLVAEEFDIENDNYNRPFPYFFYFLNPCSYTIDYYRGSSQAGDLSWYINNTIIGTGDKGTVSPCQAGDVQIKAVGKTYDVVNCVNLTRYTRSWASGIGEGDDTPFEGQSLDSILLEDTVTNVTVVEYKPTASFFIEQSDGYIEECDCYITNLQYTLTPTIVLPNANTYNITYTLFDFEGTQIDTVTYPIAGLVSTYDYVFTMSLLGDYTVQIIIEDVDCGLEYSYSVTTNACDFIQLDYVDCGMYSFSNKSTTQTMSYVISDLNGNSTTSADLLPGSSVNLHFVENGTYTIASVVDGVTTYRVVHNYCGLEKCLSDFILDILCGNTLDCSCDYDSSSEIKAIRIWTLYNTYFMKLQNEFSFNTFYTAMTQTKLDELSEIDALATKLKTLCDRENCTSNKCTDVDSEFVTITENVVEIGFSTITTNNCGCG